MQVSWRSVHLRTAERNLLVLPNSALGRETITNYSQPTDQQMLRLSFSFGLDAPPNRVKEMLVEVAREIPLIIDGSPTPRAVACDVLDDRIRYEARVSIEHGRYMPEVTDQFTSAVWYAARRAGLPLPLPHAVELQVRDVAVDPMDAAAADGSAAARRRRHPRAARRCDRPTCRGGGSRPVRRRRTSDRSPAKCRATSM